VSTTADAAPISAHPQAVQEEFKDLVAAHNKEFNPTGVPFKGPKRASTSGEAEVLEEEIAVPVPTSDVTKAALQEKGKVQEIPVNSVFELLLVDSAELWIHGLTDGVISAKEALFPLVGKFLTGQPATALQKESTPPCLFFASACTVWPLKGSMAGPLRQMRVHCLVVLGCCQVSRS